MEPKSPIQRAIDWTLVHVQELGLPGLNVWAVYLDAFWESDLARVGLGASITGLYHQCHWCGRLDFNDSPAKIKKTQKYCHAPDCTERNNSNPSYHPDCCLGQFGLIRHRYKERFKYQGRGFSETEHQQQVIANFRIYCEERFQDNLKKEIDVVNELSYGLIQVSQVIGPLAQSPQLLQLENELQAWGKQLNQAFAPLTTVFQDPQWEQATQTLKASFQTPAVRQRVEHLNTFMQELQNAFPSLSTQRPSPQGALPLKPPNQNPS